MFIFSVAAGFAWFSLFGEYLLHRFVFHGRLGQVLKVLPPIAEHKRHHLGPFFAPWVIKIAIVTPLMLILTTLFVHLLLGRFLQPFSFSVGLTGGYVALEILHYSIHNTRPTTSFGMFIRKHHFHHHFVSNRTNFGFVVGIMFDLIFGTFSSELIVSVPTSYEIVWLHDRKSIFKGFGQDFALKTV